MERAFDPDQPELMDLPSPDPKDLRDDLENLEWFNTTFGATKALLGLLAPIVGGLQRFTLIDLCSGYADMARHIVGWARGRGREAFVIAVDNQPPTLEMAREATGRELPIVFVQADVRRLPFKDGAADVVMSSLALHHFSEEEAAGLLAEKERVARRSALCLDLVRSRLAYACVWSLTQFIVRAKMTRHDARMSIRRAFTGQELKNLADSAGWTRPWYQSLPWFRHAIGTSHDV